MKPGEKEDRAPALGRRGLWSSPLMVFLLLSLAIGIPGFLYIKRQLSVRLTTIQEELSAVADLKAGQISSWHHERWADSKVIFENLLMKEKAAISLSTSEVSGGTQELVEYASSLQHTFGYTSAILVGPDGRPRLMTPWSRKPADFSSNPSFQAALLSRDVVFEDLKETISDSGNEPSVSLGFWIPVIDPADGTKPARGAWLLQIDPQQYLFPLIQTWPTASRTAETLLVRREGHEVVFLNELRHRKGTALKLRFPIGTYEKLPAALAARGFEGVLKGTDYRGKSVLAAVRHIPDTPWFIVAKIDQAEVLAPVRKQGWTMGIAIFCIIAAVALAWTSWDRRREEARLRDLLVEERRRRLAEASLAESMSRFRSLFESMRSGVAVYEAVDQGRDFVFKDFNRAAEKIDGRRKEEVLGRPLTEVFPKARGFGLFEVFQRVWKTGRAEHHPASLYEDEHIRGWRENFVYKLPSGEIVSVFDDITEQKEAEEKIARYAAEMERLVQERTAQLEAANKDLEAFTYSVSHDLRAPLRGIDGWSLALLEDCEASLDPEGRRYLARVRSETQHMGRLIDDLLQMSRASSAEMRAETVDLTAAARKIAERLGELYPERRIKFVLEPGLTARGDGRLLEVVLHNLLDNAWKFTGRSSQARVEFGRAEKDGGLAFFVRDNGAGFDMAYASKLFTAFQRLHKSSEFPGTGVGLATVQRIIRRHGGRIWAEAQPGRGATFYFVIPD